MEATLAPRIKICCIKSLEEARLAVRYGASALGLVSEMPSGPGVISETAIAEIAQNAPQGVATFLLTSRQDVPSIIAQQKRTQANTLQLTDSLPFGAHAALKKSLPSVAIVQVIHVLGEESIEEAQRIAPFVDALLLDSGNPNLPVKELGGTGRRHNWNLSRKIRESVSIPLYLAGGIHAGNIAQAIAEVGAYGIDLCSGVRTEDRLDEAKLAQLFRALPQRA